jgi:hypothetical protein
MRKMFARKTFPRVVGALQKQQVRSCAIGSFVLGAARTVLLSIEVPSAAGARYRLQVTSASLLESIDDVARNGNRSLAVGPPANELPDGEYTVRVMREAGGPLPEELVRRRGSRGGGTLGFGQSPKSKAPGALAYFRQRHPRFI